MSTSRSLNFAGELGTIQTFAGTGEFELYGAKEQYHQLDLGGHMRGTEGCRLDGQGSWAAVLSPRIG